ncbi:putative prepilin peptidase [Candidatus Nitrosocaldus cavascurensis]|jgi:flagellin-like protein|uniref:Putative prepilin peptidase n=2 Tax=Candidatus Nitrosocaldaceae TaxID=1968910 RepID=A0A2K5ASB4_9ARCH|nr:putative prepilin peptidase [Candidatus Nitrosocaldus cavascurensis]
MLMTQRDTQIKGIRTDIMRRGIARRARQGISPVIATVILIAIAVVIGVAVAAYAGGLFGTQTGSGGLLIRSATVTDNGTTLTGTIRVENQGARADSVTSIQIGDTTINTTPSIGVNPDSTACDPGTDDERIPGSTVTNICFTNPSIGLLPGQTFTIRVNLGSGNVLTYTTSVAP